MVRLPRDFVPPVIVRLSFLPSFGSSGRKSSTTATCPPTSSSSSLRLFLFLVGESDPVRLVILRLGPRWSLTHTMCFAYGRSTGRPPSSQPSSAVPMKLSPAFSVLKFSFSASMKQSLGVRSFPKRRANGLLQSGTRHLIIFLEVCVIFWDVVLLCRCREPKQTPLPHAGHIDVVLKELQNVVCLYRLG